MDISELAVLSDKEKEKSEILKGWLPEYVIDAHVHTWQNDNVTGVVNPKARVPGQTFNYFTWNMHKRVLSHFLGECHYVWTMFGFPFRKERETNEYIRQLRHEVGSQVIPFFLSTEVNDIEHIETELQTGEYYGFKSYASSMQKSMKETRIVDFFPHQVLSAANAIAMPIMLHLPWDIVHNQDELIDLAGQYPEICFIVAHMGNIYYYNEDIASIYRQIGKRENIYLDTSMVADPDVIAEGLICLGDSRILFGSDAPFSYLKGRHAPIKGEVRFQSQIKFNWVTENDFSYYRQDAPGFTMMHINIIESIKEAMVKSGLNSEISKNRIFADNIIEIINSRRLKWKRW